MPNCSNMQDARTCMGWTYFPWPLPSSSSSSSSSSFSLELYRFHRHTFAFYFLYIQTHLSLFYCPTHLPRLTPSPLTAASSVCGPGADRYRICQCCTPVYTFFLAAIVASLQPPMGDELTRTFGSHNKRAQKWHCLDIPFHLYTDSRDFSTIQFFVFFFPFTSMCTLHVWMPAVHGHMCAFAVCRRDHVQRVCVAVYTVRECGCVCDLHSRLSQPFCRKKKQKKKHIRPLSKSNWAASVLLSPGCKYLARSINTAAFLGMLCSEATGTLSSLYW